jgi:NADH:ubiquinone reductase (H+-translocating)
MLDLVRRPAPAFRALSIVQVVIRAWSPADGWCGWSRDEEGQAAGSTRSRARAAWKARATASLRGTTWSTALAARALALDRLRRDAAVVARRGDPAHPVVHHGGQHHPGAVGAEASGGTLASASPLLEVADGRLHDDVTSTVGLDLQGVPLALGNEPDGRHRVVVVGGGFGGLQAVRSLRRAPVEVTLVDRRNFHLFQPLLYQVATGALSPAEISTPLRFILKRQKNVRVVMGEVRDFDLDRRRLVLDALPNGDNGLVIPYETLIIAGGSRYSYFGHDEWRPFALEIKSLESALSVRRRIFTAFEAAEIEPDTKQREAWLTFVVVGGGPTGVEMAGQIAELARDTLSRDVRSVDPHCARILLVEASKRLLSTFPPRLSTRAAQALERLGVTVLLDTSVVDAGEGSVIIEGSDGKSTHVPTRTIVWAAGVMACELSGALAAASGAALDRTGRVAVGPELTIQGHPDVIALGDMVSVHDAAGNTVALPGLASTAMQQGRYAAKSVRRRARGKPSQPFHFVDKGNLATIGRAHAVAEIKGIQTGGMLAWLIWLSVHIFYLIGLQNRLLVLTRWAFSFVTSGRGARLITGEPATTAEAVGNATVAGRLERLDETRVAAPQRPVAAAATQAEE